MEFKIVLKSESISPSYRTQQIAQTHQKEETAFYFSLVSVSEKCWLIQFFFLYNAIAKTGDQKRQASFFPCPHFFAEHQNKAKWPLSRLPAWKSMVTCMIRGIHKQQFHGYKVKTKFTTLQCYGVFDISTFFRDSFLFFFECGIFRDYVH